jgi:hypothetical protein
VTADPAAASTASIWALRRSLSLSRSTKELQQQALAELAGQGANLDFIEEFYIFGSVARGEHDPDDIDLAFQYDEIWVQKSDPFDASTDAWEAALADWSASLSITLLLRVSVHDLRDFSDPPRKHIIANRDNPLDSIGKAKLVYTPPKDSV